MKEVIFRILEEFIIGLASGALVVFLGVRSVKDYLRSSELKREYGNLKSFWSVESSGVAYSLIFGSEGGDEAAFEVEPRVGYSQAFGVAEITRLLERVHEGRATINTFLLSKDEPFPDAAFNSNVLLFGGELVLSRFRQFCLDLGVPFYQHRLELNHRSFTRLYEGSVVEELVSQVDFKGKKINRDIGTVTRIINPLNGKLLFLFNANYSAGLLGAILATTNKDHFQYQSFDPATVAQQAVVEVPSIRDNLITREHPVHMRSWIQFQVTAEQLAKAVDKVST